MNITQKWKAVGVVVTAGFGLTGCIAALPAAYMAAAYAPAAIVGGFAYYGSLEDADISASASGDTADELANVKRVAVLPPSSGSANATIALPLGGLQNGEGQNESLLNGVVTAMADEGFKIVDTLAIERALDKKGAERVEGQGGSDYRRTDMIDAAFATGADAVVVLSATSGSDFGYKPWMFGGATSKVTVKNVSGRVLGTGDNVLLSANVSYKNGQSPQEAGKAFGFVTAVKMRQPDADVKQVAKERGAEGA
ncbi:MAG: hypothetical protein ACR2RF_25925 [Geminicoccaceae bacterium]